MSEAEQAEKQISACLYVQVNLMLRYADTDRQSRGLRLDKAAALRLRSGLCQP
jgi:hypothetical protein